MYDYSVNNIEIIITHITDIRISRLDNKLSISIPERAQVKIYNIKVIKVIKDIDVNSF